MKPGYDLRVAGLRLSAGCVSHCESVSELFRHGSARDASRVAGRYSTRVPGASWLRGPSPEPRPVPILKPHWIVRTACVAPPSVRRPLPRPCDTHSILAQLPSRCSRLSSSDAPAIPWSPHLAPRPRRWPQASATPAWRERRARGAGAPEATDSSGSGSRPPRPRPPSFRTASNSSRSLRASSTPAGSIARAWPSAGGPTATAS